MATRSMESLESMERHRWFGYLVVPVFAIRAATIFPMYPPEQVRQLTLGLTGVTPEMVQDLEFWGWVSLWLWVVILPLGILAGIMIIRQHARWPVVLLASAGTFLLFMKPWPWFEIHGTLAMSLLRSGNIPLTWQRAGFMFDTLAFPMFALFAAAYAVHILLRTRRKQMWSATRGK